MHCGLTLHLQHLIKAGSEVLLIYLMAAELYFIVFLVFWPQICREIDQRVSEYEGVDAPDAHLCSSSGNVEIAYKSASNSLFNFFTRASREMGGITVGFPTFASGCQI